LILGAGGACPPPLLFSALARIRGARIGLSLAHPLPPPHPTTPRLNGLKLAEVNPSHGAFQLCLRIAELNKLTFDVNRQCHTTLVGMGATPKTPLPPEAGRKIKAKYVFDMIYDPLETPLLKAARSRGSRVIAGI